MFLLIFLNSIEQYLFIYLEYRNIGAVHFMAAEKMTQIAEWVV